MKIQSKLYPNGRWLLGVLVLGAVVYSGTVRAEKGPPPIPAGVAMKSWQDNGSGGRYLLQVVKGQLPKPGKPITGTVTSDTNCDADVQGLSHCNNNIKLPNGSEILVIDTHNMHRNRCLGPGDQLKLTAVGKSWVMGTLAGQ